MAADEKTYNHNGKEIKKSIGKNIRVTDKGWEAIRKYCLRHSIVMGAFVEKTVLDKIKSSKK